MRFTATRNASSVGEPRIDQARYLLAQMVFQLRDIDGVDRLPAAEVAPPLVDLLLERYRVDAAAGIAQAPCGSGAADAGWPARNGNGERLPDAPQRRVHRLPLPAFLGELSPALDVIR